MCFPLEMNEFNNEYIYFKKREMKMKKKICIPSCISIVLMPFLWPSPIRLAATY